MTKFSLLKKPHDEMKPPKVLEVQLCVSEYVETEDGMPALTHWCATEAEVEAKFERVIADIQKKKSEALALLKRSREAHGGGV